MRCAATILLLVAALPLCAQDRWAEHQRAGELAMLAGNQAKAEAELNRALELAQAFKPPDPRLERSLEGLAQLYEQQNRLDKAQPMYELLVAAREMRVGRDGRELLPALDGAGRVCLKAGDVPAAETHFRDFVRIAEASPKADPTELSRVLSILARMSTLAGKGGDALDLERRAVAALERVDPLPAADLATELGTLGRLELESGTVEAAAAALERAAELRRTAGDVAAGAKLLVAGAEGALGRGNVDVAERLAEHGLAIGAAGDDERSARQVLAEVSWRRVADTPGSLAELLAGGGDTPALAQAEERLLAVANLQRPLPAEKAALLATLGRLARVACRRADGAIALAAQKELVELLRSDGGEPFLAGLDALAGLALAAGKPEDAIGPSTELVERLDAAGAPADPRLVAALERHASVLERVGRKPEAKVVKKRLKAMERGR